MNKTNNVHGRNIRWQLLVTVSAAALLTAAYAVGKAEAADDSNRPLLWIELGGQLESISGQPEILQPPFFSLASDANRNLMIAAQHAPRYSVGEDAKITYQPEDSDWLFSVSLRYGRSNMGKHFHRQTQMPSFHGSVFGKYQNFPSTQEPAIFVDGRTSSREKHAVLDFQAGKDVGLGMFGGHGDSSLSAGVRFAQFTSSSNALIHARPFVSNYIISNPGKYKLPVLELGVYTAVLHAKRDTHAVGPSISWDASVPFAGNSADASLSLDWGVNAALLFGRQRARIHHETTGYYLKAINGAGSSQGGSPKYTHRYHNAPADQNRSRSVMIPNVGGFAGISFRYSDAKISLGYRGDFFFGAMDTGIDARKSATRGFYGPFASISVGLGD
jgi:hypothetical protein